jgi:peptidoglycan/xylan/chitin deacetylase (PgdA/CDA1 family)
MLLRTLLSSPFVVLRNWFRRWRGSAPVIILFHHLVTDRPHHLGIPTELFFRHVEFIKRHYRVSSLGEAIEALQAKRVKVPTVVLTFDDGYQENFINLRAVAEETGITATLFICTEHASRQREFDHDRKRQQHNFPPLTWEQIRFLSRNGFEIGSHTRSHFDCGSTDVAVLRHEIEGSKEDLEKQLGHQVVFFAFPWGQPANMSQQAVQLAEATYAYIFSAHGGVNLPSRKRAPQRLLRCDHSNDLWELELQLQSVLEW